MSDRLQYKLLHYEATPPAKVWEEVEAALNDQLHPVADKLFIYAEAPPAPVWENINNTLGNRHNGKVVPFYKKHSKPFRYAGFAAVILFLALAINLLFTRPIASDPIALEPSKNNSPVTTIATEPKVAEPTSSNKKNTRDKQTAVTAKAEPKQDKPSTTTSRYMTLAATDGKLVRMSKKVYPEIDCAEKTATTLSKCKERIQSLQRQMATSVSASSGDFGGLMLLIKNLEENN